VSFPSGHTARPGGRECSQGRRRSRISLEPEPLSATLTFGWSPSRARCSACRRATVQCRADRVPQANSIIGGRCAGRPVDRDATSEPLAHACSHDFQIGTCEEPRPSGESPSRIWGNAARRGACQVAQHRLSWWDRR
jgi:hypothetical protein